MPEATLPLQWDLFKIADGHIQYRLVVDGSNRSIRFTVSDNNKYEIIRAEERFQKNFQKFSKIFFGPDKKISPSSCLLGKEGSRFYDFQFRRLNIKGIDDEF